MTYELAQINVAKMIGTNLDDPIMKDFVDNIEQVNFLAESSPGFVWRFKEESSVLSVNETVITTISVWKDIASLENFTYKSYHSEVFKRKKEWFYQFGKAHYALWWILEGKYPTPTEALSRLQLLQEKGPSNQAFTFKHKYYPEPIS